MSSHAVRTPQGVGKSLGRTGVCESAFQNRVATRRTKGGNGITRRNGATKTNGVSLQVAAAARFARDMDREGQTTSVSRDSVRACDPDPLDPCAGPTGPAAATWMAQRR